MSYEEEDTCHMRRRIHVSYERKEALKTSPMGGLSLRHFFFCRETYTHTHSLSLGLTHAHTALATPCRLMLDDYRGYRCG